MAERSFEMNQDKSLQVFFALLQAGLWERSVRLSAFEPIDFDAVYKLAEKQSVVGLVAAGLEFVEDKIIVKKDALPFLKKVFAQENRNAEMDKFLGELVKRMRDHGIYTLLVKGQGVAQCYARPQWRSAGDIDFFLNDRNYPRAKAFLIPLSSFLECEAKYYKHLGMIIDSWSVELHGTLRCGLSFKMDRYLDLIQEEIFDQGKVRTWRNNEIDIFLPGADSDVIFIFTHFLKHFYLGGLGLRQICDWCRLLWTYRDVIDKDLLESRIGAMCLKSEWTAFAAFAVEYLGMPVDAMPLYNGTKKLKRKARRINSFVLKVGNFGHNRDMSYYSKYPYLIRKSISLGQRIGDLCSHMFIFPLDSLRFFPTIMVNGFKSAIRGE